MKRKVLQYKRKRFYFIQTAVAFSGSFGLCSLVESRVACHASGNWHITTFVTDQCTSITNINNGTLVLANAYIHSTYTFLGVEWGPDDWIAPWPTHPCIKLPLPRWHFILPANMLVENNRHNYTLCLKKVPTFKLSVTL